MNQPFDTRGPSEVAGLGAALQRYVQERWGCPPGSPAPYCGYLDKPATLEAALWRFCEGQMQDSEEAQFWRHAEACTYCLARIRDISDTLIEAPADVLLPQAETPTALVVRLRRVQRDITDSASRMWTGLLEAVETTGRWLGEAVGEPAPALAPVLATRRGYRGAGEGGQRVSAGDTGAISADDVLRGYYVACEVLPSEDREHRKVAVRVTCRCVSPGPRAEKITVFRTLDGEPNAGVDLDADGQGTWMIPADVSRFEAEFRAGGRTVAQIRLELAGPKPGTTS